MEGAMSKSSQRVLVVGGGPAGSTTATLIARQGYHVTLAERETAPRYHIGESLLPSCLRIFDLIGVREKIESHGFQRKDGAYFDWGAQQWDVLFNTPTTRLYGFQVVRSEFDRILLDHAKSVGVDVLESTQVVELVFEGERPIAADLVASDGRHSRLPFDVLADASGRAGLMSTRYLRNRRFHDAFQNVAVWGYWRSAKRLPVGPEGAIATCSIPFGWVWAIPLHDGTLSVGVILLKSKFKELKRHFLIDDVYRNAIAASGTVADLIDGAYLNTELRIEADYSYAAECFAGPGYFLIGDAACFLDPLLSTGVHLATFSGLVGAASIVSLLQRDLGEAEIYKFYNDSYRRAYLRMLVVVGAFYQTHTGRDAHFRQAQQLTRSDYRESDLRQAFVNIISGIEDLKDVEPFREIRHADGDNLLARLTKLYEDHFAFIGRRSGWDALPLDKINEGRARIKFVNAVQEDFSLTPETAVGGIYVHAEPHQIGLRRVHD
jgi:flavin-dependent dehydrogenase